MDVDVDVDVDVKEMTMSSIPELTLEKAVDFAVQTERLGQEMYSALASRFEDDSELRELFTTLAADEEHHADHFAGLRKRLGGKQLDPEEQQYLRAASLSDIFADWSLSEAPEMITTREDALQKAFNLEKTTLGYYQALQEIIPDELLEEMVAEEKRHLVKVMKYMVTGAKVRGLGDKF